MARQMLIALTAAAVVLAAAGCARQTSAPPLRPGATPAAKEPADTETSQYCRVCFVRSGHKMGSYLPTRLTRQYKGRTYAFCSDACRQEFDKNPAEYALK